MSREPYLPIDRPKLSKALKVDPAKIQLRDSAHLQSLDIKTLLDTVLFQSYFFKRSVALTVLNRKR